MMMIFKRKISAWEAERTIRDNEMRRALLEILQEATKEHKGSDERWPEPMRDDEEVEEELKRILGGR